MWLAPQSDDGSDMSDRSRATQAFSWSARATRKPPGLPAFILLALVALLTAVNAGAAIAQERQERRVALIIGNSSYRSLSNLANPVADAAAMQVALQPLNFKLIVGQDLTLEEFREKIAEFRKAIAKRVDVALLFYAGHGVQYEDRNYLLPIDVEAKTKAGLLSKSIPLDEILAEMSQRAKASVTFLDACRDSPRLRSVERGDTRGWPDFGFRKGLAEIKGDPSSDYFVGFAAAPGKTASDGARRNSPFTSALLAHVAKPDTEINEMFGLVRRDVVKATRGAQTPLATNGLTDKLHLNPKKLAGQVTSASEDFPPGLFEGDDAPAVRLSPEAERWWLIKDSSDPKDFEEFLREHPKGNFALVAKRKYDQLAKLAKSGDPRPAGSAPAEPHAAEGEVVEVAATARITKAHPKEEAQRSARTLARAKAIIRVYGASAGLPNFVSSSTEAAELLGHMANGVTYEEEWSSTQHDREIRLKLKAKVRLLRPEKDRRLTGQIHPAEVISGQPFRLKVEISKDATIGVFAWQAGRGDGTVVRLYPENARKPVLLKAGETVRFPRNGDSYPGLAAGNPPGEKRNHEALLVVTGSTNIRFDELVPIAVAESLQQASQQDALDGADFLRKLAGIRDSELEMLVLPYEVNER